MITHFINIKNYFLLKLLCIIILCALGNSIFSQTSVRGANEEVTNNKPPGNQYALIMGISKYQNTDMHLNYADDDAVAFRDFLLDTKIVPEGNIHLLTDSIATAANFYKEVKKIYDKLKENDRVIIYFAGHGDVDNDIETGFLLGVNCVGSPYAGNDVIDLITLESYVNSFTEKKKAKVILITDACRSGNLAGGTKGAQSTLSALSDRFRNTIKLLSCGPGQLSEETNFRGGGHGIFTYYLLQALYGLADEDNDNQITEIELDKFLKEKVRLSTSKRQTPVVVGNSDEVILQVTPELKLAMQARTNGNADAKSVATRSATQKIYSGISHSDSLLIKKFYTQLRDGKLNTPLGDNAYETYLAAKKAIANAELVNSMKYDLEAGLEDEVQPILNRYTRGEFQETPYDLYQVAEQKLEIIRKDLITPDDIRYNDIKALQIYFNRAGYFTDEALKDLLVADSINPNTAYINCEIARYYSMKVIPDTVTAFKYLKKSMRLAPTWAFPYFIQGLIYLHLNLNEDAKVAFEKSLQIKPDFKLGLINLGVVYSRLKVKDEEIKYYKKAMAIEKPDIPVLFSNMGLYWNDKDVYDSALFYYRKAYTLDPYYIFNLSTIIRCFNKLKQQDSLSFYLQQIKKATPVSYNDYRDMGDTYFSLLDYKEALKYYRQLNILYPGTIPGLTTFASSFAKLGQKDSALVYLNKATNISSRDPYDLIKIGDVYLDLKDYQKAISYYLKAAEIKPTTYSYNNIAFANEYLEKNEESKKYYKLAFQLQPDYTLAINNLGNLYNKLGQYDSAIYYYQKTLALEPENLFILVKLSTAFFNANKKDSAMSVLKKLDNIKINDPDDLRKIGDAYLNIPDYNKARSYYFKGIAIKPNPDIYNNLGLTYDKEEKIDSAIKYYKLALNLNAEYGTSLTNLAAIYYYAKNYDSAMVYYKKAADLGFANERIYNIMGVMYQGKQDYDSAKKYYQAAVNFKPDFSIGMYNLAAIYNYLGNYDSAIIYFKRSILTGTPDESKYNLLGAAYLNSAQYDSAIAYYKKASQINPLNANNYVNLGHSYYLNNKYTESIPYYEKTLSIDSVSYINVLYRLGYAYLIQKRYDEAVRLYQKAVAVDTVKENWASYFYNITCARSLQGKTDESLAWFDKALKSGYTDIKHLEEDTDLDNIRSTPAFKKLIEAYFKKEEIEKYPKLFGNK